MGKRLLIIGLSILLLFGAIGPIQTQNVQAEGDAQVLAAWKFDEETGDTVLDSSGNGNNGVIFGATRTEGKIGKAVLFDGVDDYIEADGSNLNIGSFFTLTAWVKTPRTGVNKTIFAKGAVGPGHFELYNSFDGQVTLHAYEIGYKGSAIQVDNNEWHHIAVTYDGSTVNSYIDGALGYANPNSSGSVSPKEALFRIGSQLNGGQPFAGAIDEIYIIKNRVLSPEEIKILMTGEFPPNDNVPPQALNVTLVGTLETGSRLSGSYEFKDANGDGEGKSLYSWWVSDSPEGVYKQLPEEALSTLEVNRTLMGKYIKFGVTPADSRGVYGETAFSEAAGPVIQASVSIVWLESGKDILKPGESTKLTLSGMRGDFTPYNFTEEAILYASSNPDVVNVNKQGVVEALSAGKAEIRVEAAVGGQVFKDQIEIKVAKQLLPYSGPSVCANEEKVELSNKSQKVVFKKDTHGAFIPRVYVRNDSGWEALFDSGRPLLTGPEFDLLPTAYEVISESAVKLKGTQASEGYNWELLLESNGDLVKFRYTGKLTSALELSSPEPTTAFWMNSPKVSVKLDQGPDSIYQEGTFFGNSFPAAYLWNDGKEAVVFFNITPMTWMGPSNLNRFWNTRTAVMSNGESTGIGLHAFSKSGSKIPAGDMVIEYYLYAGHREDQPTGLQALDTMVEALAPLHPAHATFPENHRDPSVNTWEKVTEKTLEHLQNENFYYDFPFVWEDPLIKGNNQMSSFRARSRLGYDFSTTNNWLSPWVAILRLNPDQEQKEYISHKLDSLPLFYDPKSNIMRWGTRYPAHVGDLSMTWQNLFYHIETARVNEMVSTEDFNPLLGGNFLNAVSGLIEYAHSVNYVFPQWFDPYAKVPMPQNDVPELGKVREPWQVGSYAYVMLKAYEMTGTETYLQEAEASMSYLLNGMSFRVQNQRYDKTYSDPAEFPITELFGNAYGSAAAQKLYNITGDAQYLQYSKDFINVLLRLTSWYDDEGDAKSRDLNNLGLFKPHGGAYHPVSWETGEALTPLTVALKYNTSLSITDLLLKIYNLQRINSFYYYPPFWSDKFADSPGYSYPYGYFPEEPFYMSDAGGHSNVGSDYMAGLGMWNYLMYESMAAADDRDIMVLNLDVLDGYETSMSSTNRHFIVYNPTDGAKSAKVMMKHLATGNYTFTVRGRDGALLSERVLSKDDLQDGAAITLHAREYVRVDLTHSNAASMKSSVEQIQKAEDDLSFAYRLVRKTVQKQAKERLYPLMDQDNADLLARYVGSIVTYERFAVLLAYAQDTANGISNIPKFLEGKFVSAWEPEAEWLDNYSSTEHDVLSEAGMGQIETLTLALEQYRSGDYAASSITSASLINEARATAALERITLKTEKTKLEPGETAALQLWAFMSDESLANLKQAAVHFSSDNLAVAKVDGQGNIRAEGIGKAAITAEVKMNGITLTKTIQIRVGDVLESVSVKPSSAKIAPGDQVALEVWGFTSEGNPIDLSSYTIEYSSSNSSIATVNTAGQVTAVEAGVAQILVRVSKNGVSLTDYSTIFVDDGNWINLAPGAVEVSADTELFPAVQAIDGEWADQVNDAWVTTGDTPTHWLTIDLGIEKEASLFVVKHVRAGDYNTSDFQIQGSNDGETWTELDNVSGNKEDETYHQIDPAVYRYYRLYISKPNSDKDNYARVYEFEILAR